MPFGFDYINHQRVKNCAEQAVGGVGENTKSRIDIVLSSVALESLDI